MSFHGSNVDLRPFHELNEALQAKRRQQDEVLAEYKALTEKKDGLAHFKMLLFEAKTAVVIPEGMGSQEAERLRNRACAREQAKVWWAEERIKYLTTARDILNSQVSSIQSECANLRSQADMGG